MKKNNLFLFLLTLLGIASCSQEQKIKILAPTGAPALAFYNMCIDGNFFTSSTPANIVAEFTELGNKDVVILPTSQGVKSIQKGAPFKLAATITFGNFYLVSLGNDADQKLNDGDKVVLFQKNQIPDKIFNFIYERNKFEITYVENASDAAAVISNGKTIDGKEVNYVLGAQPTIQGSLSKNLKASIYENIQEKFKEKTNGKTISQASIFIKNSLAKIKADNFLSDIKNDIEKGINNPSLIKEGLSKFSNNETEIAQKFGFNISLGEKWFEGENKVGLGYKVAYEMKDDIDFLLSIIDSTFGGCDEEIFYK